MSFMDFILAFFGIGIGSNVGAGINPNG